MRGSALVRFLVLVLGFSLGGALVLAYQRQWDLALAIVAVGLWQGFGLYQTLALERLRVREQLGILSLDQWCDVQPTRARGKGAA